MVDEQIAAFGALLLRCRPARSCAAADTGQNGLRQRLSVEGGRIGGDAGVLGYAVAAGTHLSGGGGVQTVRGNHRAGILEAVGDRSREQVAGAVRPGATTASSARRAARAEAGQSAGREDGGRRGALARANGGGRDRAVGVETVDLAVERHRANIGALGGGVHECLLLKHLRVVAVGGHLLQDQRVE